MLLNALAIKKARTGVLSERGGLSIKKKGDHGNWTYRYSIGGIRRYMGLGTYPTVSLADARKERDRWALVLNQGKDPISEKAAQKEAAAAARARRDPTLVELAEEFFEAYKGSLRQEGASGRWMSPLKTHVFPKLGRRPVSTITESDIHDVLKPIWKTKPPTAQKAIQRLRMVFRDGRLRGHDCDPFTIEVAENRLGIVQHKTENQPSVPWQDIPKLFAELEGKGSSASCLQFMILTVVRSHGCRKARHDELAGDVWTIPAERMKGRVGKVEDFRVPLSPAAMTIIKRRAELSHDWVFTGHRGKPLSDNAMSKYMRDHHLPGTPHGFRASFRTWVQDTEAVPEDVAEAIMAHKSGGKTERAYMRSDLLERRRIGMLKWSRFVTGEPEVSDDELIEPDARSSERP